MKPTSAALNKDNSKAKMRNSKILKEYSPRYFRTGP